MFYKMFMFKNTYRLLMNTDVNPLCNLPNIVKFQLMTILSFMWSIIFTLMIGNYLILGPTMIFHLFLLLGIYFTSNIFETSKLKAA